MLKTQNESAFAAAVVAIMTLLMASSPVLSQSEGDEATADGELEEIVVTGIRASLLDAINKKKNARDIRDLITSEDIGKLPDNNVAEALQRITGVQIGRDFGEGEEISVRGISGVRIELNGMTQIGSGSTNNARGVSTFSSLPAEMFSSLEVIKSPSADQTEGGLGAIVRLNTRKPLDSKNRYVGYSVESRYSDIGDAFKPKGTLYAVDQWDIGNGTRFGASLNVRHDQKVARQDAMFIFFLLYVYNGYLHANTEGLAATDYDFNGDGVNTPFEENEQGQIVNLNDGIFIPRNIQLLTNKQDRENSAVKLTLQYETAGGSDWILDLDWAESFRSDIGYMHNAGLNGRQIARDFRPADGQSDYYGDISESQTLLKAIVGNVRGNGSLDRGAGIYIQPRRQPFESETKGFALRNETQISDRLVMNAAFSMAEAEQIQNQLYATVTYGFSQLPYTRFDFSTGNDLPDITHHTRQFELTDDNRINPMDSSQFKMNGITYQPQTEGNESQELKLDFDYDFEWSAFNQVEFGVRFATRESRRSRARSRDTLNSSEDGDLAGLMLTSASGDSIDERLCPQGYWDINTRSCGDSRIIGQPYDDVLDGASGNFDIDYVTLDAEWVMNMGDEMQTIGGTPFTADPGWGYDIEEDTSAAYLKVNFDGAFSGSGLLTGEFFGDIGLRYVKTDLLASAFSDSGNGLALDQVNNSYTNLLPSFNITFPMADNKTLLRLAASKAMGRPGMFAMAPIGTLRFYEQAGNLGNPYLKPEVVTAFDVSIEYYPESGGIASLAVFNKAYKDAIEQGFRFRCSAPLPGNGRDMDSGLYADATECPGDFKNYDLQGDPLMPANNIQYLDFPTNAEPNPDYNPVINYRLVGQVNAGESTVKGVELAFTKPFDQLPEPWNGITLQTNYTYTDNSLFNRSSTGTVVGMQDFSKNSYNIITSFEKGPFDARLAYNWRSAYFDNLTQAGGAQISKAYGQLEAKIGYKLDGLGLKGYSVDLSVTNLTGQPREWYQDIEERFSRYEVNDQMWYLTLRGRL